MATTTTTATVPAPVPTNIPASRMKSTWRQADRSTWSFQMWQYELLGLHPTHIDQDVPIHEKTDKMPVVPEWSVHRWIIWHAAAPMLLQQLYCTLTGRNFSPVAMTAYYSLAFIIIGIHQINVLRTLGYKYGFLDGDKHARDQVPDIAVGKVIRSLILTVVSRDALAVFLAYNKEITPLGLNWWALPIELGLYGVTLDFWFYWYHRIMHANDSLWHLHRTHHETRHPNALLTLYADEIQEIIDIAGIPLLTYLSLKAFGLPMGFYEWWICHQYVVFSELSGHSGLRVYIWTPSPISAILNYFNCELVIEDHDLHHRKGWKKSHNYGKQTRVWDRIFGTTTARLESTLENVDYSQQAVWPIF